MKYIVDEFREMPLETFMSVAMNEFIYSQYLCNAQNRKSGVSPSLNNSAKKYLLALFELFCKKDCVSHD